MRIYVTMRLLSVDDRVEVEMGNDSTVRTLLEKLTSHYLKGQKNKVSDSSNEFRRVVIAVNGRVRDPIWKLEDGDNVSFFCPIAGG